MKHPAQRAVLDILQLDDDADRALRHLQTLDGGRQAGETLNEALHRYRTLLFMDELDDADAAHDAFGLVSHAVPIDDPGAAERLKRFEKLSDLVQKLAAILVVSHDLETAKSNFLKRDTPAGTVEQGEQEVVIGGIRVPRKAKEAAQ